MEIFQKLYTEKEEVQVGLNEKRYSPVTFERKYDYECPIKRLMRPRKPVTMSYICRSKTSLIAGNPL